MAPHKKLQRFHQKHLEGAYDPVLRAIPLFLAVPTLALVAVDLDRYERNSAFHHVQHRQYLVLDVITLSFLGLTILYYIVYLTASRYAKIPRWVIAPVDCLLSLATTILGDMVISMRTSKDACFPPLGECTGSTQNIMAATGALLIIISVPLHTLWASACSRLFAKLRQKRKEKKASHADAVAADPEGLSFSNDFLPRESPTDMEVITAEPNAITFSNEIK